ncbi:MAG: AbrB/MazE/SpoVT family DNA-binding domain-containing protein [Aquificae bacterium]|nr:AbrB/MazE/SpoVT family DNA-binding domain-containing protein [Aquificota bacterium]
MKKTRIFKSGNSLAVRLPKGFGVGTGEVYITKEDNRIIIFPQEKKWDVLFELLEELEDSEGFLEEREQPEIEGRKLF